MRGEPMTRGRQALRALGFAALIALLACFTVPRSDARGQEKQTVALAVIVHPKNPATDVKLREARQILKLDKQFWDNRVRVDLYLPARDSDARTVMLDKIYNKTDEELTKYFVGKVFSGEIPREPSVARSTQAAGKLVARSEGAISVVPANEVPEGVKVLRIDGKKPGDEGYPLVGEVSPKSTELAILRSANASS